MSEAVVNKYTSDLRQKKKTNIPLIHVLYVISTQLYP